MLTEHPLPELGTEEKTISDQLSKRLERSIDENNGSLAFDEFLQIVLYEPGLGYYSSGAHKIGAAGDFITAPALSSLYSRTLAMQCREVLDNMEQGSVLELGAGTGAMARDILLTLSDLGAMPEHYFILEPSPELKQRQQQLFDSQPEEIRQRIVWLDKAPDQAINGIILANEVADALPFKRILWSKGQCYEMKVAYKDKQFVWQQDEIPTQLEYLSERLEQFQLEDGYVTEYQSRLLPWLNTMSDWLSEGVIMIMDYGYTANDFFHPNRLDGSLRCYFRHLVHNDPFINIGLQDITCNINFSELAFYANKVGLTQSGFTTQSNFLLSAGIEQIFMRLQEQCQHDTQQSYQLAQELKTLTLPEEMGECFKVIALSQGYEKTLTGFAFRDLSNRL